MPIYTDLKLIDELLIAHKDAKKTTPRELFRVGGIAPYALRRLFAAWRYGGMNEISQVWATLFEEMESLEVGDRVEVLSFSIGASDYRGKKGEVVGMASHMPGDFRVYHVRLDGSAQELSGTGEKFKKVFSPSS